MSKVYSHTWSAQCFDRLNNTRTETALRVFKVLSQYQHLLAGIQEGVDFIPVLRQFSEKHYTRWVGSVLLDAKLLSNIHYLIHNLIHNTTL